MAKKKRQILFGCAAALLLCAAGLLFWRPWRGETESKEQNLEENAGYYAVEDGAFAALSSTCKHIESRYHKSAEWISLMYSNKEYHLKECVNPQCGAPPMFEKHSQSEIRIKEGRETIYGKYHSVEFWCSSCGEVYRTLYVACGNEQCGYKDSGGFYNCDEDVKTVLREAGMIE